LITRLCRACRQTLSYLDKESILDENQLRRILHEAARDADRFLEV